MGEINLEEQPIKQTNQSQYAGEIFNNVKRLRAGNGSWRFENGALIITDETGTDRILIGFLENGF